MFKQILAALTCTFAMACSQNPVAVAPEAPSQNPCAGGIIDSDAALVRLTGCQQIDGDLALRGVSSVEPLYALNRVDGKLSITGTDLFDLRGLEQLRQVGDLVIAENQKLIGIGALNGVASVERVSLTGNPRLSGYFGVLRGLEQKPLRLRIEGNRALGATEVASLEPASHGLVAAR